MFEGIPGWVLVVDYVMGMIMWTLIGRAAMSIFLAEDSNFFFMKVFVRFTDPVIEFFWFATPKFLIRPVVPLFIAWFFFVTRFYITPWLLGYEVMGMLSFPLEGEIAAGIYRIGNQLF